LLERKKGERTSSEQTHRVGVGTKICVAHTHVRSDERPHAVSDAQDPDNARGADSMLCPGQPYDGQNGPKNVELFLNGERPEGAEEAQRVGVTECHPPVADVEKHRWNRSDRLVPQRSIHGE
jgi:hypothetical protein